MTRFDGPDTPLLVISEEEAAAWVDRNFTRNPDGSLVRGGPDTQEEAMSSETVADPHIERMRRVKEQLELDAGYGSWGANDGSLASTLRANALPPELFLESLDSWGYAVIIRPDIQRAGPCRPTADTVRLIRTGEVELLSDSELTGFLRYASLESARREAQHDPE